SHRDAARVPQQSRPPAPAQASGALAAFRSLASTLSLAIDSIYRLPAVELPAAGWRLAPGSSRKRLMIEKASSRFIIRDACPAPWNVCARACGEVFLSNSLSFAEISGSST